MPSSMYGEAAAVLHGVEAAVRIELTKYGFCRPAPYHLATPPCPPLTVSDGAGNGIRTRDPDLGKVVLYH